MYRKGDLPKLHCSKISYVRLDVVVVVVMVLRYYCDSGPELNKLFIFQRAEADFVVCKSHLSFSLCLEYLVGISPQGGGGPRQSFLSGLVGGVVWCGVVWSVQCSLSSALHY